MRVLITGVTGFVGVHLAEALRRHGPHELTGISRQGAWPEGWEHLGGVVQLHVIDLVDTDRVEQVLREAAPEWVFHLAGYAHGGRSFREPEAAWEGNLTATRRLYEAVARWGGRPRILYVSSGLVYGDPQGPGQVCGEDTPLRPASPYAASKAAADLLSYQVTRSPGLDVVRVRPFNQIGPGQPADYAVANFARQVVAIGRGEQPPVIETGDLSSQRDLTDVRDMAEAYVALLEKGQTGEVYNAATGTTHRMEDVLGRLLRLAGLEVEVRQNIDPARRKDTAVTRADVSRLRAATGWRPRRDLDQTLRDTLDWWRGRAARHPTA